MCTSFLIPPHHSDVLAANRPDSDPTLKLWKHPTAASSNPARQYGNTPEEASEYACRQLGKVECEIIEHGDHIEVCANCMLLKGADAFTRGVPAFLFDSADADVEPRGWHPHL